MPSQGALSSVFRLALKFCVVLSNPCVYLSVFLQVQVVCKDDVQRFMFFLFGFLLQFRGSFSHTHKKKKRKKKGIIIV